MIHVLLVVAFVVTHLSGGMPPADDAMPAAQRWMLWLAPMCTVSLVLAGSVWRRTRLLDRTGQLVHARKAFNAAGRTRVAAVVIHLAAMLTVDPLSLVRTVTGDLLVVDELLATLPVLLVFVWTWWVMFGVEHRLGEASIIGHLDRGEQIEAMPSRARSVWNHVRQDLLFIVVPVVALMGLGELAGSVADGVLRADPAVRALNPLWTDPPAWTERLPQAWRGERAAMVISGPVLILGAVSVMAMFPLVIRWLWDTVELGRGLLRDSIETRLRSCGVRVSTLRVWRTRTSSALAGGANAAVVGLVRPLRDMLFTDRLLEGMPMVELDAVVCHEAAHLRQHHAAWLALAVMGVGSSAGLLASELMGSQGESLWAAGLGIAAALGSVVLVSRRFEWQADAHAARWLSADGLDGPGIMAAALRRVAKLNGVAITRASWRHGSIALRCRKLARAGETGVDRLKIDRSVRAIRTAIVLSLALTAWLAWRTLG